MKDMKNTIRNELFGVILISAVVVALTSQEKNSCSFDETQIFCKEASGKFLNYDGHKGIHVIYIVESDMRNLRKEDFSPFGYVTTISIYNSSFDFSKQENLFGDLKSLEELRIDNSNVNEDVSVTFSKNYNIVSLVLTSNKIGEIRKLFISHLSKVEKIDLSNNIIEFIEVGAFDGLPALKQLNVSNNKLGHDFDSRFLTLSNSYCVVCKSKNDIGDCTKDDIIKCKKNKHMDQLWWKSHSVEISLQNNPICDLITKNEDYSTTMREHEVIAIEKDEPNMCTTNEVGNCFKHESRKMYFLDVCGIQNYTIPRDMRKFIPSPNDKTTGEGIRVERYMATVNLSVIIIGVLCAFLAGGSVVAIWYHYKRRPSNAEIDVQYTTAEYKANQDSGDLYIPLYTEDKEEDLDNCSNSALHIAAAKGSIEEVKDLLSRGEKASGTNKYGDTPLHYAAKGNHRNVVRYLLNQDINVNPKNKAQETPLIIAARRNYLSVVKILLAQGGDCTAVDKNKNTPLHLAVWNGNLDMVSAILEKNPDLEMIDEEGKTPLFVAVAASHSDVVRLLLERKANVHATANDGRSALHVASWNGNKDIVETLLRENCDVNKRDKKGYTPMHNASRKGHMEVLKLLLNCREADVNSQNEKGNTPLHQGANGGHPHVLQLLLESGADARKKNKMGKTPLQVAIEGGHKECEDVLSVRGHNRANKENPSH